MGWSLIPTNYLILTIRRLARAATLHILYSAQKVIRSTYQEAEGLEPSRDRPFISAAL